MTILPIPFSGEAIAAFIRGPMAWAAFLICMVGIGVQSFRMMRMTRKVNPLRYRGPSAPQDRSFFRLLEGWLVFLRVSILGTTPCVAVMSFMFHVGLLATPFLVLAHNVLLDTSFGVSFVSLPESTTDVMTGMVLLCGGFFLLRRVFVRRVRAVTTLSDLLHLFAAIAPFLTGFLAYHDVFDYQGMVLIHILCAEFLLVMIPFSRFTHMIFFVISRFLIVGEHGRASARRVWRYESR